MRARAKQSNTEANRQIQRGRLKTRSNERMKRKKKRSDDGKSQDLINGW
jgi:hypothetical protein